MTLADLNHRSLKISLAFMVIVLGATALSSVTLRKQINRVALCVKETERELDQMKRHRSYIDSQIAQLQSPEHLAQAFKGSLQAPDPRNIIWIEPRSIRSKPVPSIHRKMPTRQLAMQHR